MASKYFLTEKIIKCKDTGEVCVGYKKYLKSKHWKGFRAIVLTQNNSCHECGGNKNLQLHHIDYSRIGQELPKDVVVLCVDCHKREHHLKDSGKSKLNYKKAQSPIKKQNKLVKKRSRKNKNAKINRYGGT